MRRTKLVAALRVLASVVMLAVLVPRVSFRSLLPRWTPSTAEWLLGAIAVTLAGVVLSAVRWQRVLAALERPAGIAPLMSHSLAGLFVGNFLPSTIGGDVLRVTRLSAATGDAPRSFASVVLERLTGWLVLPVLTLAALAMNPGLLRLGLATQVALLLSLTTLGLLAVVFAAAANPRLGGRLSQRDGWLRFVAAVHEGLSRFRRRPGAAFEVLVAGFAYQLAVVLAAHLAAGALGLRVGWTAMMAFMPAVAMVQVLPLTVGGLGVREGAFVLFLSHSGLGVPTHDAIALGLLLYAINVVASLAGAPAFAAGTRSARLAA